MGDRVIIAQGGATTVSLVPSGVEIRRSSKVDLIPFAELRSLRFGSGIGVGLVIESGSGEHVIPSDVLATELRVIDARIREAMPHDRNPDPFAVVPVIRCWVAVASTRWIAIALGLLIAVAPILVPVFGGPLQALVLMPFAGVGALALIGAGLRYRGTVTLDQRGLFVVRGTRTSFVAWSELDITRTELREEVLSSRLEVQTMKHGRPARLTLRRLLGIGFPVVEIFEAVERALNSYR